MKKIITLLATLAIVACAFVGCGEEAKSAKYTVVCTVFPQYDWVREIVGENDDIEIKLLSDGGVDLHNYQPTVKDVAAISTCDMFIYVGGPSDEWAEDVLKNKTNDDMTVINLFDVLGDRVKREEEIEGAEQSGHDHDHDHTEYDEHVWLSLLNAEVIVRDIAEKLGETDPANADEYADNAAAYIRKLGELDDKFEQCVRASERRTLLFADRFPFRYFADDYGLECYAAFQGCSAESDASFATITFLAGKVDELGLKYIVVLEGSDRKIAQSVISNTADKNQEIVVMDSLQSVSKKDIEKGATYLSLMEKNLAALTTALGE